MVLTVLKNNASALQFYLRMGYEEDETSPGEDEGMPYKILSKAVRAAAAAPPPVADMD